MNRVRETVNGLLVEVFNHILFIEEQYMKHQGVTLSMTEVHILENVEKSETKTLGDVARAADGHAGHTERRGEFAGAQRIYHEMQGSAGQARCAAAFVSQGKRSAADSSSVP